MAWRAAWLVVVLALAGGCPYRLPYRECDQDAAATCCPPGSHWAAADINDPENDVFICAPGESPDAGADACDDAGGHAH